MSKKSPKKDNQKDKGSKSSSKPQSPKGKKSPAKQQENLLDIVFPGSNMSSPEKTIVVPPSDLEPNDAPTECTQTTYDANMHLQIADIENTITSLQGLLHAEVPLFISTNPNFASNPSVVTITAKKE